MIKIVTPSEMRSINQTAIDDIGIPGVVLMENAGLRTSEIILDLVGEEDFDSVCIFCGRGNNGGDGFVIARHLVNRGYYARTFVFSERKKISGDALANLKILEACEADVTFAKTEKDAENIIAALSVETALRPVILVDALLGTGIKGAVKGLLAQVIEGVNALAEASDSPVFSVDIPSGVDGETGVVSGPAIQADYTVTMGLPKRGLLFSDGRKLAGDVFVVDISFPEHLTSDEKFKVNLVEAEDVAIRLPFREIDDHKFKCGKVLVVAGSRGMTGAAVLTAMSALAMGSGLIKVCLPESLNHVIETSCTEILSVPMPETKSGSLSLKSLEPLKELADWADVVAIGPGLSRDEETSDTVRAFVKYCPAPMVIDADAVVHLAGQFELISGLKNDAVFTPHLKEFSTLIGIEMDEVDQNRINAVVNPAARLKQTIVLKGAPTVTAAENSVFVNSTGNPALATPGSGDVLTGIITSLIGQKLPAPEAAWVGAYIHGLAGDLACEEKTMWSVKASDLVDFLPDALGILEDEAGA